MSNPLEEQKLAKLAAIVERAAALVAESGANPDQAKAFLRHYFRHVDHDDVMERPVNDLLGVVAAHFRLAKERPVGTSVVHAFTPRTAAEGWAAQGATVVQIVTDDKPFLVATATMEVARQGWTVREVYHPQFVVHRGVTGTLRRILHYHEAEGDPEVITESWMHLELVPSAEAGSLDDLVSGLHRVLRDVDEAVADWEKMRAAALQLAETLTGEEAEFVRWLAGDNFTFLGYRTYQVDPQGRYLPVHGTGLGILRADVDAENAFHAGISADNGGARLVITKDNFRSTVHRSAHLDYIGVRTYGEAGQLIGEHRFLGLFGASAYAESVTRLPILRDKATEVLAKTGYDLSNHGGKAVMAVLDGYPRDELFQVQVDPLADQVERIARLKDRRQVRLFARRDPYGRFWSCLVYIPRDRYSTAVREKAQQILAGLLHGDASDFTVQVSEGVLARLHLVVRAAPGETIGELDTVAAERALTDATRSWSDAFADELAHRESDLGLAQWASYLPEGYKEDHSPAQAISDLLALQGKPSDDQSKLDLALVHPSDPDDQADLRFKVRCWDTSLSLSAILPHLTALGVEVIDERPYEFVVGSEGRAHIYDFGLRIPGGAEAVTQQWDESAQQRFIEAFAASWNGISEADGFQELVMAASLTWQQVAVLRAIARYWQQGGTTYSQSYIATALAAHASIVAQLAELFALSFDPARELTLEQRATQTNALTEEIIACLREVESLDHDRIFRTYLRIMRAMIRTNAYRLDRQALSFKLEPKRIIGLPDPRPAYEIFVYSPRIEGVHMRFGSVARGGLRWSDRAEDYRTEILGLVKAQMVKNTVIVPVGAKGGFYCKRLPDPARDREAWLAEGIACYRIFINSLVDVTDNLVTTESGITLDPPTQVVRHDGDDPYLVVAADKGTATFSDYSNEISVRRGFWLGDAFASGGSAGYDHKGMGITARGAWVSVRRHFQEMGRDCQSEDFTCVGIGDMSGDVFGNGMLLSRHIRLVAAFDHRHIFLDPHPDAATSFAERERLFSLPRSSWADYDASLLSAGGGIFDRQLKEITITSQMREALGLGEEVPATLAPVELISLILKAPVDLLWNGGIGTYVKASTESHSDAGDRANDVLRVNGNELRALCVGEGGNLGLTQRGRIEYARLGGRINTDFIDNSAGVDTSDHEVNIKILLAPEVQSGRLSGEQRDELLASMTDEVAGLVLRHNYDQNLALSTASFDRVSMVGVHEDVMTSLEKSGHLDRDIEYLPSTAEVAQRREHDEGLTRPELATLMSYTKIRLAEEVLASDLPDDPWLADRLVQYFPEPLRQAYAAQMPQHRLHREIITTVVVNEFVNRAGITCSHRMMIESGVGSVEVIRANFAARSIFAARELEQELEKLDHQVATDVQTQLRLQMRTLAERGTRWLLNNHRSPIDIAATIARFSQPVREIHAIAPGLLSASEQAEYQQRIADWEAAGVRRELAVAVAILPELHQALPITATAQKANVPVVEVATIHAQVGSLLGLDVLASAIDSLPRTDRWQTMARAALRDDLQSLQSVLTAQVLEEAVAEEQVEISEPSRQDPRLQAWSKRCAADIDHAKTQLTALSDAEPDLARMSVALRVVRSLVSAH